MPRPHKGEKLLLTAEEAKVLFVVVFQYTIQLKHSLEERPVCMEQYYYVRR